VVTAFALNCSLKASPALSNTDLLLDDLLAGRRAWRPGCQQGTRR